LLEYPFKEDCSDLNVLEATPEAEGLAYTFFERMEVAAKSKDGIMRDARAFALRATELVFRVAGVLTVFGKQDSIDLGLMRNGIALIAYSLETWRGAHGDRYEAEARADAFRLYEWLLHQPGAKATETGILRIGPRATRSQSRRDTALSLLLQVNLVVNEGRTWKAKTE
jgi:hypothetical protein